MAVKFRHKETGLFFCRAKGHSPTIREGISDVLEIIK